MTAPWTSSEVSASGQVFEFRLWAALTEQSRGQLHVFLPLTDRGIDGLVHRQTDGAYLPIQAKGRSSLEKGEVHVVVWADSLKDDRALLVSGLIVDGGLGPMMLVVPEGDFKRLAIKSTNEGRPIFAMGFGMHPTQASRWFPYLVPTDLLAERLGIPMPRLTLEEVVKAHPMWRSDVGFLGEAEVVRVLAESGDLNLFRPFPDLETSELAVLHLESRKVLGIQVKTRGIDATNPAATVNIRESSFRPSPTTYFVVLAWLRDEARFHEECLLIPSEEFRGVCQPQETHGQLKFEWHPGSTAHGHLDRYRVPLIDLRNRVMLKLSTG